MTFEPLSTNTHQILRLRVVRHLKSTVDGKSISSVNEKTPLVRKQLGLKVNAMHQFTLTLVKDVISVDITKLLLYRQAGK